MNMVCLENLDIDEYTFEAYVKHTTSKSYKPYIENGGNIKGTTLQKKLKLKKGAKVMLTQNLDTSDKWCIRANFRL